MGGAECILTGVNGHVIGPRFDNTDFSRGLAPILRQLVPDDWLVLSGSCLRYHIIFERKLQKLLKLTIAPYYTSKLCIILNIPTIFWNLSTVVNVLQSEWVLLKSGMYCSQSARQITLSTPALLHCSVASNPTCRSAPLHAAYCINPCGTYTQRETSYLWAPRSWIYSDYARSGRTYEAHVYMHYLKAVLDHTLFWFILVRSRLQPPANMGEGR